MIGVMIKNGARFLPHCFDLLESLSYPKDLTRVVVEYGKSSDNSLSLLKDFAKNGNMNVEIYNEPYDPLLVKYGDGFSKVIFDDWQKIISEDYFMLFDTDLASVPKDLIQQLIGVDEDIVAPFPWCEGYSHFYDSWVYRIGNRRFHPYAPPGIGMKVPIEVDAVGTCYLAKKEAFVGIPVTNPYPHITYCNNARRSGYRVLTCPNIEVFHIDIASKYNIISKPLPQNLGGYPLQGWVTALDPVIDIDTNIRQPYKFTFDSNPEIQAIERECAIRAIKQYFTTSYYKDRNKDLQWAYRQRHYGTFWMTRNSSLIDIMYRNEMYPSYIEIELSNKCPFKCVHCERLYWDNKVKLRDMSWDEFTLIMNSFPNLKWLAFTGIGDPWMNPIFLDAVKYVKDRNVYFELYDTFQHFTTKTAKQFVKWGVERLFVSLDAASKETYENSRVGHKWDRMIKNVKLLDKTKKKYGKVYPEINFHFVVDNNNIHEVLDCVDFVKSLNINNGFIQYSRLLHCFPEINNLYVDVPKDLCDKITKKAADEKVPITWNVDINTKTQLPMRECVCIWMPFFFSNGDVITCCAQHESNRRNWEHRMRMGNIFEAKDFKKIWYGKRYRQLRQQLRDNLTPEPCYDCPAYTEIGAKCKWRKLPIT